MKDRITRIKNSRQSLNGTISFNVRVVMKEEDFDKILYLSQTRGESANEYMDNAIKRIVAIESSLPVRLMLSVYNHLRRRN